MELWRLVLTAAVVSDIWDPEDGEDVDVLSSAL